MLINNFPEKVFNNILHSNSKNRQFRVEKWSNVNDLGLRSRLITSSSTTIPIVDRIYETLYFTMSPDSEIIYNIHQSSSLSSFETLLSYSTEKRQLSITVYPKWTKRIKNFILDYISRLGLLMPTVLE